MYFDDLKLGMKVTTAPAVIKKEKMLAFAEDYDNIPLHTDEEYAQKTPFGKLIAPILMTSVDTDPVLCAEERKAVVNRLGVGKWQIFGAHGFKKDYIVNS